MQFKTITDYALRVLMYMQKKGEVVTRQEISAAMGITEGPLIITLRRLRDAGWLESSIGADGGWRLLMDVEELSLLDVMEITEDTIYVNRCLESDQACSATAVENCQAYFVFKRYQQMTENYFSSITVADLI